MNIPKLNLTPQKKMMVILAAVALMVCIGIVAAVSYTYTLDNSNTVTYTSNPTPSPTPVEVHVSIALTESSSSGYYNQPVTFTATVTNVGVVGRTLHFYEGAKDWGQATIQNVGGVYKATLTLSGGMPIGVHNIVAADPDQ
jgi:hypothetical protein